MNSTTYFSSLVILLVNQPHVYEIQSLLSYGSCLYGKEDPYPSLRIIKEGFLIATWSPLDGNGFSACAGMWQIHLPVAPRSALGRGCSGKSRSSRQRESKEELETVKGQRASCKRSKEAGVCLTRMEGQQKDACSSHPPLGGAVYIEYLIV